MEAISREVRENMLVVRDTVNTKVVFYEGNRVDGDTLVNKDNVLPMGMSFGTWEV